MLRIIIEHKENRGMERKLTKTETLKSQGVKSEFLKDLQKLINRHSMENGSDTPDFLLASFLCGCLNTYNRTMQERERLKFEQIVNI